MGHGASLTVLSKTDALGDQLWATGLVHELLGSVPSGRVFWLVRDGYEAVSTLLAGSSVFRANRKAAAEEEAERLITMPVPQPARLWQRVVFVPVSVNPYAAVPPGTDWVGEAAWWIDFCRSLHADLAIAGCITLNWADQAFALATAANRRIGYRLTRQGQPLPEEIRRVIESRSLPTSFTNLLEPVANEHEADGLARLAETAIGRPCRCEIKLEIERKAVGKTAQRGPPLVVAPGAGDPQRAYPPQNLAAAIAVLMAEPSLRTDDLVVLRGPSDDNLCAAMAGELAKKGLHARMVDIERHDLRPAVALLQSARLLICNESSWAHLASAVGTPTVAIWGLGHWGRFLPRQGCVTVVHLEMLCRQCGWLCCFSTRRCITDIPAGAVVQAARERLAVQLDRDGVVFRPVASPLDPATIRHALLQQAQEGESNRQRADDLAFAAQLERQAREIETAEKEKTITLLAAEAAAHQRWEALCHEAEGQIGMLRRQLTEEARAAHTARELLARAERQLAVEQQNRELEADERAKALGLLQAEAEAHRRWEALCHEAEHQRDGERQSRLAEAEAKNDALRRMQAAEAARGECQQRWSDAERQRALLAQANAELSAALSVASKVAGDGADERNHLAQRCRDLEQTAAALRDNVAIVARGAEQSEARSIQEALARELALEEARQLIARKTLLGRRVSMQNWFARALRRTYCFLRRKPFVRPDAAATPRIAQINTHDIVGGAERTSYDLHVRYRQHGLSPTLIVGGKSSADGDVFKIPFREIDWKYSHIWRDRWGLTEILYPTPLLGCFEWPQLRQADVVHLHNLHGRYWNSAALVPLGLQHPTVLTLHDEYTLTGDCCYTYDCERWMHHCGSCPQIGLEPLARYSLGGGDLTRLNLFIKRAIFRAPRSYPLVVVTPTRWLARRARRSPNLRHLPVVCINNGVDLSYWKPMPQLQARQALGLPADKTIGLVVASNLFDRRKGFDVALEAIRQLPRDSNLLFVIVGQIDDAIRQKIAGLPVIATEFVTEKIKMLHLFGAADFVFAMSRVDNLPYMCVESLACGRPVFGSAVGGIPEIVGDPALGWLAPMPSQTEQIVATLRQIEQEPEAERARRHAACRRSAEMRFSVELMTNRYLALYGEILTAAREGRPVRLSALGPVGA